MAMVLGKLPVSGRPTIWIIVGQGPTVLAIGAVGGCLDILVLVYHFSFPTPSLWETAQYRLTYCLKRPLSPNQPTKSLLKIFLKTLTSCLLSKGEPIPEGQVTLILSDIVITLFSTSY